MQIWKSFSDTQKIIALVVAFVVAAAAIVGIAYGVKKSKEGYATAPLLNLASFSLTPENYNLNILGQSGAKATFNSDLNVAGKVSTNTVNGQGNDRILLTGGPNRYRTNTEGDWHMFDTVSGKNLAYIDGGGSVVATGNVTASSLVQGNEGLMGNIKMSKNWTGYPDGRNDAAELANDTGNYKKLMIVGNKSAGGVRKVGVWDRLDVHGTMGVDSDMSVGGTMTTNKLRVGSVDNTVVEGGSWGGWSDWGPGDIIVPEGYYMCGVRKWAGGPNFRVLYRKFPWTP